MKFKILAPRKTFNLAGLNAKGRSTPEQTQGIYPVHKLCAVEQQNVHHFVQIVVRYVL